MKRNFQIIGGFGIAEKEIKKRQADVKKIIDKYYNVGITEFFIGYNPPYWHKEFGFEFSPNGRFGENEQITSYDTFKESIDYVHSLTNKEGNPCEIFVTINFWYYSDITMPLAQRLIDDAIKAGIDGLIIGNSETLQYLAEIGYKGKINISTILSVFNQDCVGFLIDFCQDNDLNLNRVILPRELTLVEIKNLAATFPDIKFEVFAQGDYCRYSNGLCLSEHKYFARDICTFILKHGMEFKKSINYNYKTIILNKEIKNQEKQDYMDNALDDPDNLFISQNVVGSNEENSLMDKYLELFESYFLQDIGRKKVIKIAEKIYTLFKIDLNKNFFKYIYDGMLPSQDLHNKFIDKTLILIQMVGRYIDISDSAEKINQIQNLRQAAKNYFKKIREEKGKFGLETYYKFMLYNRTSVPFYYFFNQIPNINVVKVPLRGRDLSMMKLGLELIDEALINPGKFIDEGTLTGKYFHYDGTKLDIFSEKLKTISNSH